MSAHTIYRWTVSSLTPPHVIKHCPGCGTDRSFASSGKFRLNANGRRLDAWLIYRCKLCHQSWNRTVFERRPVQAIAPALLEALQTNCPTLAHAIACDSAGLPHGNIRVVPNGCVQVEPSLLAARPAAHLVLEIVLDVRENASVRLDALLAAGLRLSRSRISALVASGHVGITAPSRKPLRHAAQDGIRIVVSGFQFQPCTLPFTVGHSSDTP